MSDSLRPHRWKPTRLLCPWDSPGKNAGVGYHFLLQCTKMISESEFAQPCLTQQPHGVQPPRVCLIGVFPWAPPYIPCPGGTPLCIMRSSIHFPRQWWPWVGLDITKPLPDISRVGRGEIKMVWWDKRGILVPLISPWTSPAIFISLTQHWCVTWQG